MLTANERSSLVEGIVANCECWDREDVDVLNVFDDTKLQKLHAHAMKEKAGPTTNSSTSTPAPTQNQPPKQKTAAEWFNEAPPEVQSAVRNAMQLEANEKSVLVGKLSVNAKPEQKELVTNVLGSKSLDELRMLASLLPETMKNDNPFGMSRPSYIGASAPISGPTTNNNGRVDKDDVLVAPTINWQENSDSFARTR